MSKVYLSGVGEAPPMMRFGKLSTDYLRWKRNAEAIKAANWRVVERYGVEPTTDEEWEEMRRRLRHDQIADILGKPLPAPQPRRAVRWNPVSMSGRAAVALLGQANAGLTLIRRSAGGEVEGDIEAIRELLAEIDDHVRALDQGGAL